MPLARSLKIAAGVVAVLTAYGAGAATIMLASSGDDRRHDSVLDQAERRISSQAAHPVPAAQLQRAAVEGMLSALDDRWSAYYAPGDFARFQQVLAGSYTGVGVWVRRATDGSLRVISVQPQSPAARAGLHAGDALLKVGGRTVLGRSVADVVSDLRGDVGTAVTVQIRRDTQTFTARLKRAAVADDDVSATMVSPTIERLRIAAFTRGVGRWIRGQVARAHERHLDGLVLDLRDDPGGLLDEAVETASAFLDGGPVVSYEERGSSPRVLEALGHGDTGMPLVVLVDGGTASAAEIVAAALQDRGRAVLIGSRTFGKGSVQAPTQLSDGSALELTVGHYLTPAGRSLDGVGVEPDVAVPPGSVGSAFEQRAIEVLSGLTADAGNSGRG
ncbi:MAG: carboxyl-terminal processing protease [Frankiaceae bacterium]|nr:carboxyl-terminal processing protease [Frankiaceae bacterium]